MLCILYNARRREEKVSSHYQPSNLQSLYFLCLSPLRSGSFFMMVALFVLSINGLLPSMLFYVPLSLVCLRLILLAPVHFYTVAAAYILTSDVGLSSQFLLRMKRSSMMNAYQPLYLGKPFGSLVLGYRNALRRRRLVVSANCSLKQKPAVLHIVDTPAVSQCQSCDRYCECRLQKVVRRG